jgi:hypothetical protein
MPNIKNCLEKEQRCIEPLKEMVVLPINNLSKEISMPLSDRFKLAEGSIEKQTFTCSKK